MRDADLSNWAVTELTWLMPPGDPAGDKNTPEGARAVIQANNRKRFGTAASSNGIARKMKTHVMAGTHPCATELAHLDAWPEILWAGGTAWDLRASAERPMPANIDPGTPHLRSAGVTPIPCATPLWDAFIRAIWPDERVRRWALRVLAVAFTGYPDKSLPILLGETDRGKTEIINMLMSVLGSYAHIADPRLLVTADRSHASIVMVLKGRRLSFIDEAPRTGHLAQERLKQLTGGGQLTGNLMNHNPVTFAPSHTLILTANPDSEPVLTDAAVARRVRLLPCEGDSAEVIAARAAIGSLEGPAWRAEAPGVLAAMMAEAAAWLATPRSSSNEAAPLSIRGAAAGLVEDQLLAGKWLEDCTPHEAGTRSRTLYQNFVGWCRNMSIPQGGTPSETRWGRDLNKLGYPAIKRADGNYRALAPRLDGGYGGFMPQPGGGSAGANAPATPPVNPPVGSSAEGSGGSVPEPSTADSPRSNGPVSSSMEGMEGKYIHIKQVKEENTHTEDIRTNSENPETLLAEAEKTGVFPGQDTLDTTFQPSSEPTTAPSAAPEAAEPGPDVTASDENGPETGEGPASAERGRPSVPESVTDSDIAPETPDSPLDAENPAPDSPPAPEPPAATDSNPPTGKKPRAKAPRKSPKRIGPDPELAGPILSLPAVVMRNGTVLPCSVGQAGQILRAGMAAGGGALTVDVEHTGYPIGHPDYALKTVQLGDENLAVVFDAADTYSQIAIRELLAEATRLYAHSATADLVPLMVAGLCTEEAWGRMFDTVLHAKLADPQLAGSDADGLKELAADIVPGAVSPDADKARAKLFASGKWLKETDALTPLERSGWAQVDQSCQTMIVYAGSDVLDTAPLPALLPPVDAAVMERERGLQRMCARVTYRGMRLDPDHTHAKLAEHRGAKAEIGGRISGQYEIENPGSAQQVAEVFARLGVQLPHTAPSPKFPQGQPSTARAVLLPIAKRGAEGADLAQTLLDFRHHATVLALLLEPFGIQADHGDGRVRPTIYTLGADTGRTSCVRPNLQQLCYSSSTELLTENGFVPFPAITGSERVAQWKPDGTVEFVTPLNVIHEAYDGPMIRIAGDHHEQVVTPNHRVYSKTRRGALRIEEAASWLEHGARDKIVDRQFIRGGRHTGRRLSADELRALRRAVAVQADGNLRDDCKYIGLQFTKKRKAERARELGLEVQLTPSVSAGKQVYRAKAYAEDCEPWLILPEKVFSIPALLELDAADLQEFLDEVMFWDGDFTRGQAYNQSVTRTAAVDAVELAAVLSGHSTCRSVKQVDGRYYACVQVHQKAVRHASRTNVTEVPSDGTVHCVEVPSGAVVVRHGGKVIVSGNSRQGGVRACITADPGMMIISADFNAVELRVAAALSQDAALIEMITEGDRCRAQQQLAKIAGDAQAAEYWKQQAALYDLHWRIARQVWGPDAVYEDRYNAKRGVFGHLYGAGTPNVAGTLGISMAEAQAVKDTLAAQVPGVESWSGQIRQYVRGGGTSIQAYSGRVIWLDKRQPHKGPNYCLSPETPILRGDLSYRPAGDVQPGDALVGFDEYRLPGNGHRRMRMAEAEKVSIVQKPSVRVVTDDRDVVCSEDHMWLVRPRDRHFIWRQAADLRLDDELLDLGTWKQDMSRTAGWLAGLYDGEGHLAVSSPDRRVDGRHGARMVEFSQLPGLVMDAYRKGMAELGLPYTYRDASPGDTSRCARAATCGMADILRVLGTLQPVRFRPRYAALLEGASITGGTARGVPVRTVEPVGVRELMSVQTSTRTLVADGFLSHNCIQGSGKELLTDALLKWQQTRWGDSVILPVHDEVLAVVPEDDAAAATEALVESMATSLHGVPIVAEASEPSYAWADAS
jgi:DNA polymerase I-like protein with 3'-5' exonuclease and polymerase domains